MRSSYSKTTYRLLKQYRKTGYVTYSIEKFKELLCVPDSYQIGHITDVIIKPVQNELKKYFKGLKINKVKAKKGRKIVRIEFHFTPEDDILKNGKYITRDGNKYIEKEPLQMTQEEIKKVFPALPNNLSENLDDDLDNELEKFLLERRKLKEKNQEIEKIQGQVEFDV